MSTRTDFRDLSQVLAVDGTVVTFEHQCGHTSSKDYGKGPAHRRLTETGVRIMARSWQNRGGVNAPCPECGVRR